MIIVNIEIKETHFCRRDLRIATKLTDSRESEFPTTFVGSEKVVSGVYFYTLTAGEFSATRKMLIQK